MTGDQRRLVFIAVFSLVVGFGIFKALDAKAVCQPQYPYDGCSSAQIADLEAGTIDRVKENYPKWRWHQDGSGTWANLGPAANNHLHDMFDKAVDRWVRQHNNLTVAAVEGTDKLYSEDAVAQSAPVQPRYTSWVEFKQDTECGGSMGFYTGLKTAYCALFGHTIMTDEWQVISDVSTKLVITCSGLAVFGAIYQTTGGLKKPISWTTLTGVAASKAAKTGAVFCAVSFLLEGISDVLTG